MMCVEVAPSNYTYFSATNLEKLITDVFFLAHYHQRGLTYAMMDVTLIFDPGGFSKYLSSGWEGAIKGAYSYKHSL